MKFMFVSSTLRELAYEQLTFSIKRALHKKIAEWYEYTYPNELKKYSYVLAKNWEAGSETRKSLKYYFLAAQHEDAAGDYGKVYTLCMKARGLLFELSSEASIQEEDKLLLSRLDILLYKSIHESAAGSESSSVYTSIHKGGSLGEEERNPGCKKTRASLRHRSHARPCARQPCARL